MQNDFTSKILYSNPDVGMCSPISGLVCMQVHMLANRWNSSFPFNFNVKGMLQASGSMGSWCWEGSTDHPVCVRVCVCVCVRVCACVSACVCVWRKGEIMNLSIDMYHLLCPTVSCFRLLRVV